MDSRKDFIALADWLYDGMSPKQIAHEQKHIQKYLAKEHRKLLRAAARGEKRRHAATIRPCHSCGTPCQDLHIFKFPERKGWNIVCPTCGCKSKYTSTFRGAVKDWNGES